MTQMNMCVYSTGQNRQTSYIDYLARLTRAGRCNGSNRAIRDQDIGLLKTQSGQESNAASEGKIRLVRHVSSPSNTAAP
jgi:hypothetical protein